MSNLISFVFRLFAGLWILIIGGFMHMFVGGEIADTGLAVFGAFLFSGEMQYFSLKMERIVMCGF